MKKHEQHYDGEWNVTLVNFKKLISGNGSLRAAFWGVWVIGTVVLNITILLTTTAYSAFTNNSELYNIYETYNSLFLFPYMIFGYVVVLRNSICIKPFWLPTARVFATIVMLENAYEIYKNT